MARPIPSQARPMAARRPRSPRPRIPCLTRPSAPRAGPATSVSAASHACSSQRSTTADIIAAIDSLCGAHWLPGGAVRSPAAAPVPSQCPCGAPPRPPPRPARGRHSICTTGPCVVSLCRALAPELSLPPHHPPASLPYAQGAAARTARSSKKKASKGGGGTGYGGSANERVTGAALALQAKAKANSDAYDKAMAAAVDRVAELLPLAKAAGGLSAAAGATVRCGGAVPVLHGILRVGSLIAISERPAVYLSALRLVGCAAPAPAPRRPLKSPCQSQPQGSQGALRSRRFRRRFFLSYLPPNLTSFFPCLPFRDLPRAMAEHPELIVALNSPGFASLAVPTSGAAGASAAAAAADEDDEDEAPEPSSSSVVDYVCECVVLSLSLCLSLSLSRTHALAQPRLSAALVL